jgi:hypothetical protein
MASLSELGKKISKPSTIAAVALPGIAAPYMAAKTAATAVGAKKTFDKYDPIGPAAKRLDDPSGGNGSANSGLDEIGRIGENKFRTITDLNHQMDDSDTAYAAQRKASGQGYIDATGKATSRYKDQLGGLLDEARDQSTNAKQVYSGTILPNLKNIAEEDYRQAYGPNGAMSLEQAGDPNNQIHQAVRGMYNTQASNVQNQGLAASGGLGCTKRCVCLWRWWPHDGRPATSPLRLIPEPSGPSLRQCAKANE